MTNSIIDSKQCKNCQTEIMLSKQKCPYCNENNEWEPELGIKPYLSIKTIWLNLIYPVLFPIIYLLSTSNNPSLPKTIVTPYLLITGMITIVGVVVMSKQFNLGKALFTLNGVLSFLFTIFHLQLGTLAIFDFLKILTLFICFVNTVTWYYITNKFYSLEEIYQTKLDDSK